MPPKLLAFVIAGRLGFVGTKKVLLSLSAFGKERVPFPLCPDAYKQNIYNIYIIFENDAKEHKAYRKRKKYVSLITCSATVFLNLLFFCANEK